MNDWSAASSGVADAEKLHQRLAQRQLCAALTLRQPPFAGALGQRRQRLDGLDGRDEREAAGDQQQQEEIERDVQPPAAPVEAGEAVVGAERQRRDDGDGEQQDQPDDEAHVSLSSTACGSSGQCSQRVVGPGHADLARLAT
jgi:hypothetical protein